MSSRRHRTVLVVTCLALATVVSSVPALNVAIPELARDIGATQTELAWIVDAYALVFAALLLTGGALGDRIGRRRVLLAGLLVFGLGAAIAMTASGPTELIVLRGVLGVGAALVMPATLSTITATFPDKERVKGIAVWTGVAGASAVLGVFASAILLEWFSWRSIFALNVVLAVVAIAGTARVVPESADSERAARDPMGSLLAVVGLGVLVYSVLEAPTYGWGATRTVVGCLGGVVVIVCFVAWEMRTPRPLLDPRHFRDRAVSAGTLSLAAQFFCFFGFIFVILQYFQEVRGDSPLVAAVSMLVLPAGLIPAARSAPILVQCFGQRLLCGLGLSLIGAATLGLHAVGGDTPYWVIGCLIFPIGLGMGFAMTPATTAITAGMPRAQQGVASALNDLSRELGGALGIAVLSSLMASTYRDRLRLPAEGRLPPGAGDAARSSLAAASQLGPQIAGEARTAFIAGMQHAFLVSGIVTLVAGAVVVVVLKVGTTPEPVTAIEDS
ncbi:MAG: MFS transporter [Gordonia sp. (in: high G+C Gram-positive bacteria)]